MDEMMEDTMAEMEDDDDEMEDEANEEVDKVLWQLTDGKLGMAGEVSTKMPANVSAPLSPTSTDDACRSFINTVNLDFVRQTCRSKIQRTMWPKLSDYKSSLMSS